MQFTAIHLVIDFVTLNVKFPIINFLPIQSNSSNGRQILEVLRKHFDELDYTLGVSFIYRMLGGLRGEDNQIQKIASLLTTYDKYCVENGFMEPNRFYYIGQKNS